MVSGDLRGQGRLGFLVFAIKPWLGLAFFAAYGLYFWREMRGDGEASPEELEPLKLQPKRTVPSKVAVLAQTVTTLVPISAASQLFVAQLEWAGPALGLSPVVVALLLSPVATELPEVMNALIWVRQGKTQLALGNISGAMMIQATVPSGLGLLFTPWLFDTPLLLAGIATIGSVIYLLVLLRAGRLTPWRLVGAATFYSAFAVALGLTAGPPHPHRVAVDGGPRVIVGLGLRPLSRPSAHAADFARRLVAARGSSRRERLVRRRLQ